MSGRMTPISQGRSGDNPQNYRQGTQGRQEITSSGWQPGQGGGFVQHFGQHSQSTQFCFQQPGTYNVGIRIFGKDNGTLDPPQGCSRSTTPIVDRRPSPQAGPSRAFVPQSQNMTSLPSNIPMLDQMISTLESRAARRQ